MLAVYTVVMRKEKNQQLQAGVIKTQAGSYLWLVPALNGGSYNS